MIYATKSAENLRLVLTPSKSNKSDCGKRLDDEKTFSFNGICVSSEVQSISLNSGLIECNFRIWNSTSAKNISDLTVKINYTDGDGEFSSSVLNPDKDQPKIYTFHLMHDACLTSIVVSYTYDETDYSAPRTMNRGKRKNIKKIKIKKTKKVFSFDLCFKK